MEEVADHLVQEVEHHLFQGMDHRVQEVGGLHHHCGTQFHQPGTLHGGFRLLCRATVFQLARTHVHLTVQTFVLLLIQMPRLRLALAFARLKVQERVHH